MMSDPIADMLTRIRNAYLAKKSEVTIPYSKIKFEIISQLQKENFIGEYRKRGRKKDKVLLIKLIYNAEGNPAITEIKRVSRPSRRVYAGAKEFWPFKNGFGARIISTPQGIMTDKKARKLKVGGEVICEVW